MLDKVAFDLVFLPVLQFLLSLSLHQCSVLIHSSRTYAVFLPALHFSPVSIIPPMLHTHSFIYLRRCIRFFCSTSVSPVSIIPPMLHTHSFIYLRRCIRFYSSTSVSPVSIIPPMLHTHSFIYLRRCIKFFSSTSVSPVSIIPPMIHTHSFIYLRRCIRFFSSTSVSPVSIIPPMLHTHSFIYTLFFLGQTGDSWEPSKKKSFGKRGALDRKHFHLVLKGLNYPHLRSTVSTVKKQEMCPTDCKVQITNFLTSSDKRKWLQK